MGKKKKLPKIAVVVDYDNFRTQCRNRHIDLDWRKLKDRILKYGQVVFAAAYTDVRFLSDETGPKEEREDVKMIRAGFAVMHCPKLRTVNTTYLKDMVDTAITQVMHQISFLDTSVDAVVIASADRDFIAPINALRDAGKTVYVLTPTRFENPELRRVAGNRIIYHKEAEVARDERRKVIEAISDGDFSLSGDEPERVYLRSLVTIIRAMRSDLAINNGNFSFRALQEGLLELGIGKTIDLGKKPSEAIKQRLELLTEAEVLVTENRDERFIRYVLDLGHDLVRHVCEVKLKPVSLRVV